MTQSDGAMREIQAPCEPATTLRAAVLSIDATLDLETVLAEHPLRRHRRPRRRGHAPRSGVLGPHAWGGTRTAHLAW
ncbi:MAG: hypothetical protein OXF56_05385 [Rhodobacteraceae bacterium]|nr:hypothetical protein [Paracoccaceae bacterium]